MKQEIYRVRCNGMIVSEVKCQRLKKYNETRKGNKLNPKFDFWKSLSDFNEHIVLKKIAEYELI